MWEKFINFIKENDINTVMELVRQLDWGQILRNPLTWVITLALIGWIIWKKQYKLIILAVSGIAFMFLLQYSLPPSGEKIEFSSLLTFLGGSVVIIGLNLYIFLIKGD
jgi:hypothetical protein